MLWYLERKREREREREREWDTRDLQKEACMEFVFECLVVVLFYFFAWLCLAFCMFVW